MSTELICGLREASCICGLLPDHEGPHDCADDRCQGMWEIDEDGQFRVVRLPTGQSLGDGIATLFAGIGDEW